MEDLKKEKPKHKVLRDSDNSTSPMFHDNAGGTQMKIILRLAKITILPLPLTMIKRKVIMSQPDPVLNPLDVDFMFSFKTLLLASV